jgi:hypothetical protein
MFVLCSVLPVQEGVHAVSELCTTVGHTCLAVGTVTSEVLSAVVRSPQADDLSCC